MKTRFTVDDYNIKDYPNNPGLMLYHILSSRHGELLTEILREHPGLQEALQALNEQANGDEAVLAEQKRRFKNPYQFERRFKNR